MKDKQKLFVRGEIRSLTAYEMDNESARIKLDANENPYDLPVEVKEDIFAAARVKPFNRYPDPEARDLREQLASSLGVPMESILLGNGSDEILQLLVMTYGAPGFRAFSPVPTFAMYRVFIQVAGMFPVYQPLLKESFELDINNILAEVAEDKNLLTFIAYPNNPTGNCFDREKIKEILKAAKGLVVLDEAYFEFSGKTFLKDISSYSNLIVLRTFSKAFGLAGLRVGYAVGNPEIIKTLGKVKLPYNLNTFSQLAAQVCLGHQKQLLEKVQEILEQRDKLLEAMEAMSGVRPFPSDANFILFRVDKDAGRVFDKLKERGILIRNLSSLAELAGCLRVTVGKPEENEEFLQEIEKILKE